MFDSRTGNAAVMGMELLCAFPLLFFQETRGSLHVLRDWDVHSAIRLYYNKDFIGRDADNIRWVRIHPWCGSMVPRPLWQGELEQEEFSERRAPVWVCARMGQMFLCQLNPENETWCGFSLEMRSMGIPAAWKDSLG